MNWYKISKLNNQMPKRSLGKTGYNVGIFSLGGQGSLEHQGNKENCINIIQRAYELGVNYFDTSPIYGPSEDYYGEALKGIRDDIFLTSKTDKRDKDGSLKEIEKSLKRLNTDHLDLCQIHHLDNMEEVEEVTSKNGALEALKEMKEQGVVKYLGITGHEDPKILIEIMNRYDFDTVLCPVNACDMNMDVPFLNTVVKEANNKNMGIIGMKVLSQGYIFNPEGIKSASEPLMYSMSQPISTIIVGCDSVEQLEENIAIAKSFTTIDEEKKKEIEDKTKDYKERACFFRKEFGGYDSKNKLEKIFKV
jgi:aryl-alcohol dehydrogenase-like predicted oxidoreductase